MECPKCGHTAEIKTGRVVIRSRARTICGPEGRRRASVPTTFAPIANCQACGWTTAGMMIEDHYFEDTDLIPMSFIAAELAKHEEDQRRRRYPPHEPGE